MPFPRSTSPRLKDLLQEPHRFKALCGLSTGRDAAVVADDFGHQLPTAPPVVRGARGLGCVFWAWLKHGPNVNGLV